MEVIARTCRSVRSYQKGEGYPSGSVSLVIRAGILEGRCIPVQSYVVIRVVYVGLFVHTSATMATGSVIPSQ